MRLELIRRGYAVYPSFERAATAFARIVRHYEWQDGA